MAYKGNRDNPKKRANKKVKADPKFSGGTTGEKFKPMPTGTGPFVTPDRDIRTDGQIFEPDVNVDPDRTPLDGGFAYKNLGRNTLKILKTAAALTQIPTTVLRTGLTISGIGGRM